MMNPENAVKGEWHVLHLRDYLSIWQKMQAISEGAGSAIHIVQLSSAFISFQCSNIKESCYKKPSYTFRPQICYGNSTWNVKLFSTHVQNDRKSNQKSQYQFTCKWKATKEIIDIELIVWSLGLLTSCALAQNFICIINIRGVISCIWEVSCHLASQSKPR